MPESEGNDPLDSSCHFWRLRTPSLVNGNHGASSSTGTNHYEMFCSTEGTAEREKIYIHYFQISKDSFYQQFQRVFRSAADLLCILGSILISDFESNCKITKLE